MFLIKRDKLLNVFIAAIKKGNLIIVGSPGVGKSWLLEQGVRMLKEENTPCIALKADAMNINDVSDFRSFWGITSTIESMLNHISGGKRSILIIDALDAVRSELKQAAYRDLIKLVLTRCENWSIVVSIRTYDAKHSKALLNLFPSNNLDIPQEFQIKDINNRHLNIPLLGEEEILEGVNSNENLKSIYQNATFELKELFKYPFNLWLLDRLMQDGMDSVKISRVRTVIELFNLYWEYRICSKDDYLDRLKILEKILIYMVDNHTLSINLQDAIVENLTGAFKGLLSEKIIIPLTSSEETLGFEHNIIFDYAVSRLLMKEEADKLFAFLTTESSRPIFLRPSINYYFARLWHGDRSLFWNIFWFFQYKKEGEYLSILPILTFVNELSTSADFDALLNSKPDKNHGNYEKYLNAVNRTLQVLSVVKTKIGVADSFWIENFLRLSEGLETQFVDPLIRLLKRFVDARDVWGGDDYNNLAQTVRNIFKWGWSKDITASEQHKARLREILSFWIVPLISRTYQTNPTESRALLSQIINNIGPKIVIREVYSLTQEIESIWRSDPEFAAEIYIKVFEYEESSKEATEMRGGVLALTSNRKQDYEGCYFLLVEKLSKFLDAAPENAVKAVVEVVDILLKREKLGDSYKGKEYKFKFFNKEAKYKTDGNFVWDERDFNRDEYASILKKFSDFLGKQGAESQVELLRHIIDIVVTYNSLAVIWKYFLNVTIQYPKVYIPLIYPLLIAKPVMFLEDTNYTYANFLNKCYKELTSKQRAEIEGVILSNDFAHENEELRQRRRDRLLSQIPFDFIELKETKEIVTKLKETSGLVANTPHFSMGSWESKPYTEEDWLEEEGVKLNEGDNRKLLDLSNALKNFSSDNMNKIPSEEESLKIWDNLVSLKSELENDTRKYDEKVKVRALTHLTSACERILRNSLIKDFKRVSICEEIIHIAANSKYPEYDQKYHEKFDSPHWSPDPRIEAAEGIMVLIRNKEYVNKKNIDLIKKLAKDPVPVVRYHIVRSITMLYRSAPQDMWLIAKSTAEEEETNAVLAALSAALSGIAGIETDKVLDIFETISSRQSISDRKKSGVHNDPIVSTITQLYIFYANARANQKLADYENNVLKYYDELSQVAITSINYLTVRDNKKFKDTPENIRMRTRELLARILDVSCAALEKFKGTKDEKQTELIREIYHSIEIIAQWLYFTGDSKREEDKLTNVELKQYFEEIKPLMQKIVEIGFKLGYLSPSTTHHLVELCNRILEFDPKGVIKIVDDLCALPSGYTFDSFALGEITKLIENSVADHKNVLKEEETMKHLMNIIDNFVKAGWNEAIELSLKLDEIWR